MKKISFLLLIILFIGCKKDRPTVIDQPPPPPSPPSISIAEYQFDSDANSGLMFQDGETLEMLTSEARRYEIAKVLRVKAIDATTIEVANFAPADIIDATILITIQGQPKPIKLFKIGKIRAHAVKEIKYSFIAGSTKFLDIDNKEVDLAQYKSTGIPTANVTFDFTGDTELIKKLKSLAKFKWKIKFHDYDKNNNHGEWKDDIEARDVRRYTGFMINLAYLFQNEETKTKFLEEPITGNDKLPLTTEQKQVAFQKIIDLSTFNIGVVGPVAGLNVAGLGGPGGTYGVDNNNLSTYLTKDICYVGVHELGHMLDYWHDSTMTYPVNNRGSVIATGLVYKDMLLKNAFPIRVFNYYKPSDL